MLEISCLVIQLCKPSGCMFVGSVLREMVQNAKTRHHPGKSQFYVSSLFHFLLLLDTLSYKYLGFNGETNNPSKSTPY